MVFLFLYVDFIKKTKQKRTKQPPPTKKKNPKKHQKLSMSALEKILFPVFLWEILLSMPTYKNMRRGERDSKMVMSREREI